MSVNEPTARVMTIHIFHAPTTPIRPPLFVPSRSLCSDDCNAHNPLSSGEPGSSFRPRGPFRAFLSDTLINRFNLHCFCFEITLCLDRNGYGSRNLCRILFRVVGFRVNSVLCLRMNYQGVCKEATTLKCFLPDRASRRHYYTRTVVGLIITLFTI